VIHSDGKLQVVPSWLHGILFCGDCNIPGDTPSVSIQTLGMVLCKGIIHCLLSICYEK